MSRKSLIAVADEQVPIVAACRFIGMDLPDGIGEGRAIKVYCPFGTVHHMDGGIEPAMRIYVESNHVFCFAGCGAFGPVGLAAHALELTRRTAAKELLHRIGYRVFPDDIWTYRPTPPVPNTALLTEALKTFCRRVEPEWATRQFEPAVSAKLGNCLALLPYVKTEANAETWLGMCKTAMSTVLGEPDSCLRAQHADRKRE